MMVDDHVKTIELFKSANSRKDVLKDLLLKHFPYYKSTTKWLLRSAPDLSNPVF